MNAKDFRIDTFANSSKLVRMRITHIPTGVSVDGSGVGRIKLREALMQEIREKLKAHEA